MKSLRENALRGATILIYSSIAYFEAIDIEAMTGPARKKACRDEQENSKER